MEIIFPHEIVFSNKEAVSVGDVARSLIANEQIVLAIGKVLESCFEGLTVEKINIEFRYATTNSPLREAFAAGILVAYQQSLTTEVPKMIETATGIHVSEQYATVVTVIFLAIAIYGIEKAWELFKGRGKGEGKPPAVPAQITNNFGTIVNSGGPMIGVTPAELAGAVVRAFPPKEAQRLAKAAIAFIGPAKREKGTAIIGAGMSIEPETIEEAPSELDIALDEEEEIQQPFEKREVVIHATDIDHSSSGWAGHITGVWEKRLRMKLFPSIQPAYLFGKEKITADVIVMLKRKDDGSYVPYLFHVVNVYN